MVGRNCRQEHRMASREAMLHPRLPLKRFPSFAILGSYPVWGMKFALCRVPIKEGTRSWLVH
jgi:hypothetical protein